MGTSHWTSIAHLLGTETEPLDKLLLKILLPAYGPLLAYIVLLADAITLDPSITSLVGNGITVIVLAWYVIYDVRVRTPAMLSTFSSESAASRKFAEDALDKTRKLFADEQHQNRIFFAQEQREMRSFYDKQIVVYQNLIAKISENMRNAVHDVRDVAQETVTIVGMEKQEIVKAKKDLQIAKDASDGGS